MTVHAINAPLIVAFESPQTPGGGIAPVIRLRRAVDKHSLLFTPLHPAAKGAPKSKDLTKALDFTVAYKGRPLQMRLLLHKDTMTYFVDAQGCIPEAPVFDGFPTPYNTDHELRDALLFAAAFAAALPYLEQEHGVRMIEGQDWQGAAVALTVRDRKITLTLHNVYDSVAVSSELLRELAIDPAGCPGPAGSSAPTVLERAIPLTVGVLRTVSEGFVRTLLTEPLQAQLLANHLQSIFRRRGVVGVNNGPFKEMAEGLLEHLVPPDPAGFRNWKLGFRREALAALQAFPVSTENPVWGDRSCLGLEDFWFMMAGRNDPRQKGFEIAAEACRLYLEGGGTAKFIFCPLVAANGLAGIRFLEELASLFPRDVLVFPGFCPSFAAFRKGADFGVLASHYEPFGMANEYYLDGVAVVARATGGLLQQVVPLAGCAAFSDAVRSRVPASGRPTGILYREPDNISSDVTGWRLLNDVERNPDQWRASALYRSMVSELALALSDAERVAATPCLYADMVIAGALHIQSNFSWQKNKAQYERLNTWELNPPILPS
jgi:glycogen synthase